MQERENETFRTGLGNTWESPIPISVCHESIKKSSCIYCGIDEALNLFCPLKLPYDSGVDWKTLIN
jgi:hypothetical protein